MPYTTVEKSKTVLTLLGAAAIAASAFQAAKQDIEASFRHKFAGARFAGVQKKILMLLCKTDGEPGREGKQIGRIFARLQTISIAAPLYPKNSFERRSETNGIKDREDFDHIARHIGPEK